MRKAAILFALGVLVGAVLTVGYESLAQSSGSVVPLGLDDGLECAVYIAGLDSSGALNTQVLYASPNPGVTGYPGPLSGPASADLSHVPFLADVTLQYGGLPNDPRMVTLLATGGTPFDFNREIWDSHGIDNTLFGLNEWATEGGGWNEFRAMVDTAPWQISGINASATRYLYGLNNNGRLYRYHVTTTADVETSFQEPIGAGSLPGFGSVRSIALIARETAYDTLLANTTTGRLFAITIPHTATMTATTSTIRASGWQNFSNLIVSPCGTASLVAGVNNHTGRSFVYGIAHLSGKTTTIQTDGESPLPINDRVVTAYDGAHNNRSLPHGA